MRPEEDDLPDHIDVVMEMSRTIEPVASPSPAPPLATSEGERLPGHPEHLADRARGYVETANSANVHRRED